MPALPDCRTLLLHRDGWRLDVTLNRPEVRNALSAEMVSELTAVLEAVRDDRGLRAIVLRGAGGQFCAGGDIKGFGEGQAQEPADGEDPFVAANRRYGHMLDLLNTQPQATVALVEGAVRGGGMGLTCTVDVAIATADASFGLPEATLGLPAAQVCVFVAERIGLTQARRLVVTGAGFDADRALALGLIHEVAADTAGLEMRRDAVLAEIALCEPAAIADGKAILHRAGRDERAAVIDDAARRFAAAMRGPAGREGVAAFLARRRPSWAG